MSKPSIILPPNVTMTPDEAEYQVMTRAPAGQLFALPVGQKIDSVPLQMAFERLLMTDHIRLMDVQMVPLPEGPHIGARVNLVPCRFFILTAEGRKRLTVLEAARSGQPKSQG